MSTSRRYYEDHGNAYRSDGPSIDYAPGPSFTIQAHDFAGRFLYEANKQIEDAKIAVSKLAYASTRANAFGASDDKLEELKNAARDVEMAIAKVIEDLSRAANDQRGEAA